MALLVLLASTLIANWTPNGVALSKASGNQEEYPRITSDGLGGAIVTWQRSGSYDIYAQRVNASGAVQWTTNGVALCTATGNQEHPQITSDGLGGAIVTWHDYRSGTNYDIYAQRVNVSGAVQWTTNGVALCTATGNQRYPQVVSDGAGGAIVTWYDYRSGTNYGIYAQRVNASGVVQWTTDGVALCTATGNQMDPMIVSDGAGGAIVTWEDSRSGNYDIYAQRVNASGAVQWTANGIALCTATGGQGGQTITPDGLGGAIVTWSDSRGGIYSDIYAQRVNSSGAVQWTANGVALCTATWDQYFPTITSDGAGGAIVAWKDNRSVNPGIYAQKVNASGVVQWTIDGAALCTATGYHYGPTIVSDGAGGAIVTWYDTRTGYDGIYAQRVNSSGTVQWTANGVALCTLMEDQWNPAITSDGWGGAIVTWQDSRMWYLNSDIYAQRVDANGLAVLMATDAPAVPIELHQNYPNPFNPATTLTYSIEEKGEVTLKIYDASGKYIASLVDRQEEKGSYAVEWNGRDEKGSPAASGIYFYRLTGGNQTISKKMVLLR